MLVELLCFSEKFEHLDGFELRSAVWLEVRNDSVLKRYSKVVEKNLVARVNDDESLKNFDDPVKFPFVKKGFAHPEVDFFGF